MASGNTLATFHPYQNEPPAASYATLDTRNGQPVLDFDGSTDEEAIFSGVMPSNYAGGGVTAVLHVMFTSATSGTANIEVSIERGNTDADANSFDAMTDGSAVPNGTSGVETQVTIPMTNGVDSVAAGDKFRVKVRRDADGTNGTDDITTDMELITIELRET